MMDCEKLFKHIPPHSVAIVCATLRVVVVLSVSPEQFAEAGEFVERA
jgi:hypothetical protein